MVSTGRLQRQLPNVPMTEKQRIQRQSRAPRGELSLKANLAAFGYACVHPVHFPGTGMLYVRGGRIVAQKHAGDGWTWLHRLARKWRALKRRRRGR